MRLKIPNPVVSEELRLDCLYVDPDIKVLRATDPGRGLVNAEDQLTPDNVSQCKHLFYTKKYKCRNIYMTGGAGLGKSMFCKQLVDLWCKADCEIVTHAACSSGNIDSEASFSESSDSQYDDSDAIFSGDSGSEDGTSEGSGSDVLSLSKIKQQKWIGRKDKSDKQMKEDRRIMSEFKLLFYITLRESQDQYHVADMIDSQILQQDGQTQHPKASVWLKKVPCLVIIDGLDEWVCPTDAKIPPFVKPGIPGRDWLNQSNVYLTTTRSWKFDILQLTSSEVDKHVELVGFSTYSSNKFCYKITKLLKSEERHKKTGAKFQTELRRKGLTHLRNIPVILTQLICLWFDNQDLGQSHVQLYCSILEMLLKRANKNLPKQTCETTSETARKENLLPKCFLNRQHCQAHQHLLVSVCTVAFKALFNQTREHSLVFESSQIEILGVDQNSIDLCLKSGILSQSKVLGKWSVSEKKMSFLHKKLQEFLAAVFIGYSETAESVLSDVTQFCSTVDIMLEMSQVWMFLSGIRPDLAKQLLTDLVTGVVLKDTRLLPYRTTLEYTALARSIQTCIVDCVVEARRSRHIDLCLPMEDFVIDRLTISSCLESMLIFNKAVVKSVYINTSDMTRDTVEQIMCQIQDTRCLQKLYLDDISSVITNMEPLCQILENNNNNLTCLGLEHITLTTASSAAVCGALHHVTEFRLYGVTLSHEQIEQLLLSVSQAHDIRQLELWCLNCTDHGDQCRRVVDLSGHTQMHTLDLVNMYVDHLPAVSHCMKSLGLSFVSILEKRLRQFIYKLSSVSHTRTVNLVDVVVTGDSENPVDLTDLNQNDKLVVTQCQYNDWNNTWRIELHTRQQQTTTESDNKTQACAQRF